MSGFGRLSGRQFEEFSKALREAFEPSGLRQMLRTDLDDWGKTLEDITMASDMPTIVFELVTESERDGRTYDLIKAAFDRNPNNPSLRAFWLAYQGTGQNVSRGPGPTRPPSGELETEQEAQTPILEQAPRESIEQVSPSQRQTPVTETAQLRSTSEAQLGRPRQFLVGTSQLEKLRSHQRELEAMVRGYMRAWELFDPCDRLRVRLLEAFDDPSHLQETGLWREFQEKLEEMSGPLQALLQLPYHAERLAVAGEALDKAVSLAVSLRRRQAADEAAAQSDLDDAIKIIWDNSKFLCGDFRDGSESKMGEISKLLEVIFSPIEQSEEQQMSALAKAPAGREQVISPRPVERVDLRRSEPGGWRQPAAREAAPADVGRRGMATEPIPR